MSVVKHLGGVNNVTVDVKGRVSIPSRYRQKLNESCNGNLIVTANVVDRLIMIYPKLNWPEVEEQLQKLPSTNINRYVQRMILSHATECELDNNGRISLPLSLRKEMRIEKSCILLGVNNKFELWDQKIWDDYMDREMKKLETEGMDSVLKDLYL